MQRDVASTIVLDVTESADLVFAIAVSSVYPSATERLVASLDGAEVDVAELPDAHGTRLHRVRCGTGRLEVSYTARVDEPAGDLPTSPTDLLVYTRPSRYAESDALGPTAWAEFSRIRDRRELLAAVSSWVGTELAYVSGASLPTDGAVRTLLNRRGVCRDFAHLCVALLRARDVPARVVSVYAPGLAPMDFHAVAEAWVDDAWHVVDATTLAPRSSLVRIATGRDAADTAFLTIVGGRATLTDITVTAVVDALPGDDVTQLVQLT
ncbi:transglutaminase family protein [Microbacterium lushaniae]|nr:transglutaminase family protein [Microbacterium lushaniae]KAA9158466.1 transglutaminase family protein [Microbacterium lushaniae]